MATITSHELERGDSIATTADVEMKPLDEQHEQAGQPKLAPLFEDDELNTVFHDDNAEALRGQDLNFTEEEKKKLLRRQDLILPPLMAMGIGILLVDKKAIGNAATLTLQTDLHLHGSQYSWAVSIYFFGLLIGQYPANVLIQRYPTNKVAGIAAMLWSFVVLGTMGVQNASQLLATQFLLGLFESPLLPAYTAITSRFYLPEEQPVRFAYWNLGNTIFPIPFFLIYYGLGNTHGPLEAWRWIFLLLGLCSMVSAVLMYLYLPDQPSTCRWLTPRQRAHAVTRMAKSQIGIKSHVLRPYQIKEALLDPRCWMLGFLFAFQQSPLVLGTNFSGLTIKGFGYTGLEALLLQIPQWALGSIGCLVVGWLCTYVKFFQDKKTLCIAAIGCIMIISCVMLNWNNGAASGVRSKAVGMVFITMVDLNLSAYSVILSLLGQNIAGSTKKQVTMVITFIFYCLSNICIPQSFLSSEAPHYRTGLITVLCTQVAYIIICIAWYVMVKVENRRRDKAQSQEGAANPMGDEDTRARILAGLQDETDKKNPYFRYLS